MGSESREGGGAWRLASGTSSRSLLHDESGQDLVEYALIAAVIGLGATATMKSFADHHQ